MKPREPGRSATEDMFRERLENLLDDLLAFQEALASWHALTGFRE